MGITCKAWEPKERSVMKKLDNMIEKQKLEAAREKKKKKQEEEK